MVYEMHLQILPFVQADGYFLKVMLIGVLCFFSNAPFMNRNEMYVILRPAGEDGAEGI